jgi:hypothetical protein
VTNRFASPHATAPRMATAHHAERRDHNGCADSA